MNEKYNARCPLCGEYLALDDQAEIAICPKCGESVSALKAKKYFKSLNDVGQTFKTAHGENFAKVNILLDEAYGYVAAEAYDMAREKVDEAFSLTDSDYRVYMALVAVLTKNYTDLNDQSHLEFINKAIALADAEGKAEIKRTYRPFYEKKRMTDDQMVEFEKAESNETKSRLEKGLKRNIPFFDSKERRQPLKLGLSIGFSIIGLVGFFVLYFLEVYSLSIIAVACALTGFLLFKTWFTDRDALKAFNALLDLYDAFEQANCDDRAVEVFKAMKKLSDRFEERETTASMTTDLATLCDKLILLNDKKINEFLLKDAFFSKYVESEE